MVIGPDAGLEHRAISRELLGRFGRERLGLRRRRIPNRDMPDLDALGGPAFAVDRRLGDLLHDLHAVIDLAENGVLTAERRLVDDDDEELRSGAIRPARHQDRRHRPAGHLRRTRFGLDRVLPARAVQTSLGRVFGQRIAALHHAELHHPVKRRAVVATGLRLLHEVGDLIRRRFRRQVDDERTERGVDDGLLGWCRSRLRQAGGWRQNRHQPQDEDR